MFKHIERDDRFGFSPDSIEVHQRRFQSDGAIKKTKKEEIVDFFVVEFFSLLYFR